MRGVIACAGKSTRLFPSTKVLSKQLLPLYDKPLIYYPISMLMKAGIKEIAIITNEDNFELYQKQLGDGSDFGISLQYFVDHNPMGTIGSFKVTSDFVRGQKVCFVLGDNFFYGDQFDEELKKAVEDGTGAYVFGYPVKNPQAFGVAEFDKDGKVTNLIEKPKDPPSNMAVTGIYVYDENCLDYAYKCPLSKRGEYEVTDLNNMYLKQGNLKLVKLSKKNYWLDAGNSESLFVASKYVRKMIKKTKHQIGHLDEIAYKCGYISKQKLQQNYETLKKTEYGKYLEKYLK